ncbi:hypothetical protein FRC12_007546 [Ceratobasidium sp. 428]|nr:hypothetical protein FRC12_007546 [Ceratobasidium sp. 428]
MFAPSKLALLAITGLGLISGAAAAPVEVEVPPTDAAAAHQGWVTHCRSYAALLLLF